MDYIWAFVIVRAPPSGAVHAYFTYSSKFEPSERRLTSLLQDSLLIRNRTPLILQFQIIPLSSHQWQKQIQVAQL